jgi:LacI family transcriptional regulator
MISQTKNSQQRVTLKSLAAHLGLSISTVSRALKEAPDIGRETIALVKKTAAAFDYAPDLRGVKLRTGQTFTLVYLKAIYPLQDVPEGAVAAQIDAITSGLQGTPYQLQIVAWNPAHDDPLAALKRIVERRLSDGVLLDTTEPQDPRVRYLMEHKVPFVTYGRTELFTPHSYVDANNEKAAFDATRYLLNRGHRRIALMGPSLAYSYALQRRRGYLRALEEQGLPVEVDLVREDGQRARESRAVTAQLLSRHDRPTGFVCVSDSSALGVMAGIRDSAMQVGPDCEVVSRDSASLSGYLNPPIPTCYLDIGIVAKSLCEFLLRRIAGEPAEGLQKVFDCEFIER